MRRAPFVLCLSLLTSVWHEVRASEVQGLVDSLKSDPAAPVGASGPIIQNRKHKLRLELSLGGALLPADAYSKEGGGVLSFTYHYNNLLGWEILHAHGYADWRGGLRTQLEDNFGYPPQRFPVLRYVFDSNFVVSPIYTKLALLNHQLAYLQLYGVLGGGLGVVEGGEPEAGTTEPGRGRHVAVLVDAGLGVRLWLTRRLSLRYDLRQYVSFDALTGAVGVPLFMSLGLAIELGRIK